MASRSSKFWTTAGLSAALLAIGAFILNQAMGEGFKYAFGKLFQTYGAETYFFAIFVFVAAVGAIVLAYKKLPDDRKNLALVLGLVGAQLVFLAYHIVQMSMLAYMDWPSVIFLVGALASLIWLLANPGVAPLVALLVLELYHHQTIFFLVATPAIAYAIWAYWSGNWRPAGARI